MSPLAGELGQLLAELDFEGVTFDQLHTPQTVIHKGVKVQLQEYAGKLIPEKWLKWCEDNDPYTIALVTKTFNALRRHRYSPATGYVDLPKQIGDALRLVENESIDHKIRDLGVVGETLLRLTLDSYNKTYEKIADSYEI